MNLFRFRNLRHGVVRGKKLLTTSILLLVFSGLLLVASCTSEPAVSQAAKMKPEAAPVRVASVTQKTVPLDVEAIGNVEAYSTISVKSLVEGQINHVYFREGQYVRKGDLLFAIDPRPFQATLNQSEANLARDMAQLKLAQLQLNRNDKLFKEGIISNEQADQYQTNVAALQASVRADQAAVDNARVQLGYCDIRSPIEGRTGSLLIHEGNIVKANDVPMVVINQIIPIYVTFSVPESYLEEIKRERASHRLQVEAVVPGDEQHPMYGFLSFIDNAVNVSTGTIRMKGTFQNTDKRLWPGQFVNVTLVLAMQTNATLVPSQAVQTGQKGEYVFVVKPNLTVAMQPIVVSRMQKGMAVIEKGLHTGEKVVTDGQLRLAPGTKVVIKE